MTTIIRHGGEAHAVRPDRVYRTSVLSPIVGYQPGADVQAVAQAFTQGPPRAGSLAGLGAGPFARLGMRIKAALAERRARKFMMAGLGAAPMGPAITEARVIAPQLAHQIQMLAQVGPHAGAAPARAAQAMAFRRFNTYHRAG